MPQRAGATSSSASVVVEVATLTQRRLAVAAARALHERLIPMLRVVWVDRDLHDQAFSALLAANRRRVSLVDWTSFTLMRRHGLSTAFAYDDDFTDQGFELLPP